MAGPKVLDGSAPRLRVSGLRAGESVTVHTFRRSRVYEAPGYTGTPVLAHAEAVFAADRHGMVDVDDAEPMRGTYSGADPLGLLWSGTRLELGGNAAQPITQGLELQNESQVVFRVETGGPRRQRWIETRIELIDGSEQLDVREVALPGLNGAFARPKVRSVGPVPAILLLHGSEGGSTAEARASAIRFANLGYAAFALNYFAWPAAGLKSLPPALVDIPVEVLATARTWLTEQPGVDAGSVAVWGVSKGAEFALVAAAHYDWIDRVVACVPSDVVWSGFGRAPAAGEVYSSWSVGGKGLPYIPYDHYEDALQGKFSAAFVHQRSLQAASDEERAAARIPIEKTRAKLLLLAATNDVVWPSGAMTAAMVEHLRKAGRGDAVREMIFPDASHFICGTGSEVRRLNPVHKPEGNDPTPEADAHAAEAGWRETKKFLSR